MKCPFCSVLDTKVIDSRMNQTGDLIRRRRECPRCEGRFTAYERVEEVIIIKKDGRRQPFDRSKMIEGMQKAVKSAPSRPRKSKRS